MNWENDLTQTLHITYPFVQAPMLGVTTPEMVAAISNTGGLGSLPVGGISPDKTRELIRKTKSLTERTFSVNLFTNDINYTIDEEAWNSTQDFLEEFSRKYGLPFTRKSPGELNFFSYEDQLEILIQERIPVVTFTFGILNDDAIDRLHENQVLLGGTATSVREAKLLNDKGIDIITVQGMEAGGHRGTFLHQEEPKIGLMALLPQVVDTVNALVLAAGGIADGRAVKAAMALGADGFQVGTAFVGSEESAANHVYKETIQHATAERTVLTRAYTGRLMRCLGNDFIESMETAGIPINNYPVQGALTRYLRSLFENDKSADYLPMLAGQNVRKSSGMAARDILLAIIAEAER